MVTDFNGHLNVPRDHTIPIELQIVLAGSVKGWKRHEKWIKKIYFCEKKMFFFTTREVVQWIHCTTARVTHVQCRATSLNKYTWKKATNLSLFSLSWWLHTWRRNISAIRNSHFELFLDIVLSIFYLKINPTKDYSRRLVSKTGTQSI